MLVIGFRAHLGNLMTSAKTVFSKYSHTHRFWGLGLGYIFWGPVLNPLVHHPSPIPLALFITFSPWPCLPFPPSSVSLIQQFEYSQRNLNEGRGICFQKLELCYQEQIKKQTILHWQHSKCCKWEHDSS